jgi:hypothetical protein
MSALLQAFGLGLGATVYVLTAYALARGMRNGARGAVALYWRLRTRAEAEAQVQRVVELRSRRPEPGRSRRAA